MVLLHNVAVPDRIACPYCHQIGFVRTEQVIKGTAVTQQYYCGKCNRSWATDAVPRLRFT